MLRRRLLASILPAALALSTGLANAAPVSEPRVAIETTMGTIVVQLSPDRAPITVKNFLRYVNEGHYTDTIFHRVIAGFMIQGGGFTEAMKEKPTHEPIPLEARGGLPNNRYTIAMARTSYPHSATAQFYINVADNDFLNHTAPTSQGWGYAVFGRVVAGEDVVDEIAKVRTSTRGFYGDVPVEDVVIEKAEIVAD